jgi:hypothetical protein
MTYDNNGENPLTLFREGKGLDWLSGQTPNVILAREIAVAIYRKLSTSS